MQMNVIDTRNDKPVTVINHSKYIFHEAIEKKTWHNLLKAIYEECLRSIKLSRDVLMRNAL